MTDVLMPQLSDSMEQGTIIAWFKATGDHVEIGDELCEIETDKATVAYAAEVEGELEIFVDVDATAAVGQPIARIGVTKSAPAESQSLAIATDELGISPQAPTQAQSARSVQPVGSAVTAPAQRDGQASTLRVTPLARRSAAVHGIALADVRGTGPLGRITRADVLSQAGIAVPTQPTQPKPPPPTASAARQSEAVTAGSSQRRGLSRLQQVIARRMAEAKATIPHFQVQTEADMGAATALRAELKTAANNAQPVPSVNDLIIKAAAIALRGHPLANGSYRDGGFELHDAINIGVAVAADEALVVPTVFDADTKSLGQIASETRRLASSVREGSITPAELSGATFTVSNLGMFGMTAITPVINPPQAAILGVGAVRFTLARVNEEIIERSLVTLTLSCDHRILYGADAARFLADIRDLLQTPLRLAL